MKVRYCRLVLPLSLICLAAACQNQGPAPSNNAASSNSKSRSAEAADSIASAATSTPAGQAAPPAVFTATQDQLRKAFDDYELKGEAGQKVGLGESQSLSVLAQGSHGAETLKLTILFLSPVEQAKSKGYEFGLVAKQRTPDDRKDVESSSIATIMSGSGEVNFRVWLEQPKDADAAIPAISYKHLDKDGHPVNPSTQPDSYVVSPSKDLIGDVAIAEDGLPLVFPLKAGSVPNLTDKMDKMTLVVSLGGGERNLEFKLK